MACLKAGLIYSIASVWVFGGFVPCPDEEEMQTHPRPPMPVSQVNLDEWRTYQDEMAHFDNAAIRQEEQRLLEEERRKIDEETMQQRAKLDKTGKLCRTMANRAFLSFNFKMFRTLFDHKEPILSGYA